MRHHRRDIRHRRRPAIRVVTAGGDHGSTLSSTATPDRRRHRPRSGRVGCARWRSGAGGVEAAPLVGGRSRPGARRSIRGGSGRRPGSRAAERGPAEDVCDVPKRLEGEAAQLIGGEGVALISSETKVFDAGGQQLTGDAATTALAGADSVSLKAQLERPAGWRRDEDGQPAPTFGTSRADITD